MLPFAFLNLYTLVCDISLNDFMFSCQLEMVKADHLHKVILRNIYTIDSVSYH